MKINRIFTMILLVASLVGCTGTGNTSSSSQTDGNSTSSTNQVTENAVKIKSINAKETEVEKANVKARNRKNANNTDDLNYIIITRPQTDITFTITLDNPEAYGIDALRVYCDDETAQIQVDGEFKPIAQESDGTRVINWASEDPYTKTYNIRTTSEDAINSFKVVDVRLAGHDKFQSKETNSTDLGNNELHIYKMDEDAYSLNVIENTFDYIKFNFNIKDEYKDIISNIRVNGLEMDEGLGYYTLTDSKIFEIVYDYYIEGIGIVQRKENKKIGPYEIVLTTQNNGNKVMVTGGYLEGFYEYVFKDNLPWYSKTPNVIFNMKILDCEGNVLIPEIYTTDGYTFEYIDKSDYDLNDKEHHAYFYYSDFFVGKNVEEMENIDLLFRFKIGDNIYIFEGPWWKCNQMYNIILVEEE